jgi:hypothetical protein
VTLAFDELADREHRRSKPAYTQLMASSHCSILSKICDMKPLGEAGRRPILSYTTDLPRVTVTPSGKCPDPVKSTLDRPQNRPLRGGPKMLHELICCHQPSAWQFMPTKRVSVVFHDDHLMVSTAWEPSMSLRSMRSVSRSLPVDGRLRQMRSHRAATMDHVMLVQHVVERRTIRPQPQGRFIRQKELILDLERDGLEAGRRNGY